MRIPEGGVGYGHCLLGTQRGCESLWAQFQQALPRAVGCRIRRNGRQLRRRIRVDRKLSVGLVDRYLCEPGEEFGSTVGRNTGFQELRTLVDERRDDVAGYEILILKDCLQKGDVGGDTADAEFGQGAP